MSETLGRRCAFVPGRVCNVEGDEIPLEVCRLCLETWRSMSHVTVKRAAGTFEMLRAAEEAKPLQAVERQPVQVQQPVEREEAVQPPTPATQPERVDMAEALAELDRLFAEDKISLEEYIQERKRIVESSRRGRQSFMGNSGEGGGGALDSGLAGTREVAGSANRKE